MILSRLSFIKINNYQTNRFGNKILQIINSDSEKNEISILGWAFKKDTNDSRESASIYLSEQLLKSGLKVKVYDPKVSKSRIIHDLKTVFQIKKLNNNQIKKYLANISIYKNVYEATYESGIIAISTEWEEFKKLDWSRIYTNMKKPAWIFDGRNLLNNLELKKLGFKTFFIGQA